MRELALPSQPPWGGRPLEFDHAPVSIRAAQRKSPRLSSFLEGEVTRKGANMGRVVGSAIGMRDMDSQIINKMI